MKSKPENSRLKNSILNVSANTVIFSIQTILTFIVRTFFIRKLGSELLGLDSLLVNVLSMLSIAELGVSTAISYGLYEPLANKKVKKINAYMSLYKKIYHFVGITIIILGLILALFLNRIVGNYSYSYLYLVYFLYLFDTASLYFISYKEILIIADQKNYMIFKYNMVFKILLYIAQLFSLILFSNYIFYLLIMIFTRLFNRIVVNRFITKEYKNIDFNSEEKLDQKDINKIKSNVWGLFCYRLGDYIINSSDNVVISMFINISTVGIYTNYLSITTIIKTILKNVFSSITASFGNLSLEENKDSEYNVFNMMSFMCFILTGYVTLCFLNLINPLITLWLGKKFIFEQISVIIICFNFYLTCSQLPMDTVKEAHGFYHKDRYIPIIQAIINVVISIILTKKIGFNGVILGTTISYLFTVSWTKAFYIYKYIFNRKSFDYYYNQIKYLISILTIYLIDYYVLNYFNFTLNIINFVLSYLIISIIYVIIIILLYFKNNEFKSFYSILKRIVLKKASR